MRTKIAQLALAACVTGVVLTACNSQQKKDETTVVNDSTMQQTTVVVDTPTTAQQWERFKAEAQQKIQDNKDSIAAYEKRMDKAGSKAKAKTDKRIEELKQRNEELKAKLSDYKDEGKDKWEKFKHDFNNAMDTLGQKTKAVLNGDKM